MAAKDLVIRVVVEHKDVILGSEELELNDDILDLVRERTFGLVHQIEKIWERVVKNALINYDKSKWEK